MNYKDYIKNPDLLSSIIECEKQITPILQQYISHFPEYTDHSINHSWIVLRYAIELLDDGISKLNEDELYVLIMAALLHDIGMSPSKKMQDTLKEKSDDLPNEIRKIHHELSYEYIIQNWETLKIPNKNYAKAIGLVAMGHRKVDLFDSNLYEHEFIVKGGKKFVCLPYLAGLLRLADELDITNDRTPELLFDNHYPSEETSKEEWEKHRANYFINYRDNNIIISAECSLRNVYYGLLEQKNKIQSVINDFQKLIHLFPKSKSCLSLKYSNLIQKIETIGFIPIQIGFSFDFQNTFNAFIGKNLYNDDFVAIREVIQNAIDSCLYKTRINTNYTPSIKLKLSEDKLEIEDNGLGMDFFIIENYFAKLNSSYYLQESVSKKYESISQFGVGVFSYFLLCDSFDVETKKENNDAIKFRVTNNSESSFYFFEKPSSRQVGTKITFNLNNKLDFNFLVDKVQHFFKYIDVELIISDESDALYKISKKDFQVDKSKLISENIKVLSETKVSEIDLVSSHLDNDIYEGQINLFVLKQEEHINPKSLYDTIVYSYNPTYDIYQKGIYINTLSSIILRNTVGAINIKSKLNLNISRNSFSSSDSLNNIISAFENDLIEKVFCSWQNLSDPEKCINSNDFIKNYLSLYRINDKTIEILKEHWFIQVYDSKGISILNFKNLLNLKSLIILNNYDVHEKKSALNEEKIKTIYDKLNIPLILCFNESYSKNVLKYSEKMNLKIELLHTPENDFFHINTLGVGNIKKRQLFRKECYPCSSKETIIVYPNIGIESYINSEHVVIKYLLENESRIERNSQFSDLWTGFLDLLREFIFYYRLHGEYSDYKFDESIKRLNDILYKINSIEKTNFEIKNSDFPEWMNKIKKKHKS